VKNDRIEITESEDDFKRGLGMLVCSNTHVYVGRKKFKISNEPILIEIS
jgi:hypothetical protein